MKTCTVKAWDSIKSAIDKQYDGDLLSFGDERKVFTYPYSELIIKR